ncbi:MAG: phosphatidate cytidylyltransferase [Thermodesulfobacteriota bacterium]|nr:phosphatidate cytidylyltransferase [Thermodesulfobacteriota bacterium]
MHLQRWLTALVLIPAVISLIYFAPSWLFAVIIGVLAVIALFEYYRIVLPDEIRSVFSPIPLSGFAAGLGMIAAASLGRYDIICLIFPGVLVLTGTCVLPAYRQSPVSFEAVLKQVAGQVYLSLMFALVVMIHAAPHGATWVLMLLILVFIGDTGAYYTGSYLGRHKLLPLVSPKKTVEGSLGGMAATVAGGMVINAYLPILPWQLDMPQLPWGWGVLFFVVLSVCAQAGDLFESIMKRDAGVKDSGGIMPGHGGLLDRIDGVLFAVPVMMLFKEYVFA